MHTTATLADRTPVSFDRGFCGPAAIAAAVTEARANPGRVVRLVAAEHPARGGAVLADLRFLVADHHADDLAGHVRSASEDFPGVGGETYARPDDTDAEVAAGLALRLLAAAGTARASIFRPAL